MSLENKSIEEVWQKIKRKATENSDLLNNVDAVYTFTIDDGVKKDYSLILNGNEAKVESGIAENANCHLAMTDKNFKKLLAGDLNATTAFMTGRLKLKGNIGDALKLENLLKNLSF